MKHKVLDLKVKQSPAGTTIFARSGDIEEMMQTASRHQTSTVIGIDGWDGRKVYSLPEDLLISMSRQGIVFNSYTEFLKVRNDDGDWCYNLSFLTLVGLRYGVQITLNGPPRSREWLYEWANNVRTVCGSLAFQYASSNIEFHVRIVAEIEEVA